MPANVTKPKMSPLRGWLPLVLLPVIVLIFTPSSWPRWTFMWLLAFVIYAGSKWLTWRRTPAVRAPWWRHAGYLVAWPGMDANGFLNSDLSTDGNRPSPREWLIPTASTLAGTALFWGAARFVPEEHSLLIGWTGMIGLILMLHFGSFQLLCNAWRLSGVDARPLMNRPVASVSVSEFWGRRWNTAFRDLTYRFLFRPLTSWVGPRWAIFSGFVFSGLVHDLVISIPSGGGYGGPTLFFVIQGSAMFVERSSFGRNIGLGRGFRGWAFTMAILILPAFGLFHPPFVRNIIVPFMKSLGAR